MSPALPPACARPPGLAGRRQAALPGRLRRRRTRSPTGLANLGRALMSDVRHEVRRGPGRRPASAAEGEKSHL